ncbi:dihydroxyacetone kinase family protein [Microbacterium sp. A204]|uniref:dihydroxyacetone kinase family protein n=1 Tax=Microbacterium sp. A204 TaxID=3457321 RepID=UPI003FD0B740
MTKIVNDPAEFAEDSLEGYVKLYPQYVRRVPGGIVRAGRAAEPKVAVIVGGGSGHYPAFTGYVGQGFADGAVVGNIFTSPSASYAYSVAKRAHSGKGIVFSYGNYAGDVMNFGIAAEQLEAEGISARTVIVTDDVASAPASERVKRRGIAGDFVVFKMLSAAAETGADLDEVVRVGTLVNDRTFTIGIAFDGCTFPGADDKLFTVPEGHMSIGLGVHGEPGIEDAPLGTAKEIAKILVDRLLAEAPAGHNGRVAPLVNGLGRTKWEELYLLWAEVSALLEAEGLTCVEPEVGELITSLDMSGVSLTLLWLDDELEPLWNAPCETSAFRKGAPLGGATSADIADETVEDDASFAEATASSKDAAERALALFGDIEELLRSAESELGRIDAVAGDGDHGRGMVRGVEAATAAAAQAVEAGAGLGSSIAHAGDAWAENAGGTSGVLWGSALRSLGLALGDENTPDAAAVTAAARAFRDTIVRLGKATVGDKTMVDAMEPFVSTLTERVEAGAPLGSALADAAADATRAAEATAQLSPKLGRARPLAAQSIGTADAGATSFAMIVTRIAAHG